MRISRPIASFAILALVAFVPPSHARAATLLYSSVVQDGAAVRDFALGPSNVHHLLLDGSGARYATDAGGTWATAALDGSPRAIDLGPTGVPYVLTSSAIANNDVPLDLRTVVGGAWVSEPVVPYGHLGSGEPSHQDIAVGSDGSVHAVWALDEHWLFYRARVGGTWGPAAEITPVGLPVMSTFGDLALVLDESNQPRVLVSGSIQYQDRGSVCDQSSGCLVELRPDGAGGWAVADVAMTIGKVRAVRSSGATHIALATGANVISHFTDESGGWQDSTLPAGGLLGSVDVGPAGPVVFFNSHTGAGSRRADWNGTGWTVSSLTSDTQANTIGAVDSANNAHLAFTSEYWHSSGGLRPRAMLLAPDVAAPVSGRPTGRPLSGAVIGTSIPTRVQWSATDIGSGVSRYQLQQRLNAGAWTTLSSSLVTAYLDRALSPGTTLYQYRVRGIDKAGNVGQWTEGAPFRSVLYQEGTSLIKYAGTWGTTTTTTASGGRFRYASAAGASATITFNGRAFGLVAPTGPTYGSARIYVDGALRTTISLYRSTSRPRAIVFSTAWSSSSAHTVKVVVVGTAGRPRVAIDAFVAQR